jgi:phosphoglycolate phosphatase-like HAD superfamily hydrolase
LIETGIGNADFIASEWIRSIEKFTWCSLDRPYEDSLTTLNNLKGNYDFKIIVLTARKFSLQVSQEIISLGFNEYIDELIIVRPEDSIKEKTKYLNIIGPVIFIGDSETDYYASEHSGTRFVALSRGQRSPEFLKGIGPIQIEKDLKFLRNDDSISRFKKNK